MLVTSAGVCGLGILRCRRSCGFSGFFFLAALVRQSASPLAGYFCLFLVLRLLVGFTVHFRLFGGFEQKVRLVGPGGFVVGIVLDCGFGLFQTTHDAR